VALLVLTSAVGCAGIPKADRDLFAAIEGDDDAKIDHLIALGANVNVTSPERYEGLPPLAWASGVASPKTVELLVARGANINGANARGDTALHVAAYRQRPAVAALLIQKGAMVNAQTQSGFTPLQSAMWPLAERIPKYRPSADEAAQARKLVELLLSSGARVGLRPVHGPGPLHVAAMTGSMTLVRLLLEAGADVDNKTDEDVTPLYLAAKKDVDDVAALLLARGADVDSRSKSGYVPLTMAAEHGNAAIAKLLIAHGASVNAKDNAGATPLLSACRGRLLEYTITARTRAAKAVRRDFAARDVFETRVSLSEVQGDYTAVAVQLITAGADPNVAMPGYTPLVSAAIVGDLALAEALITHGATLDDTSTGESALHAAIAEGHIDVAKLLIERGASVNVRNMSGKTPLHFLARSIRDRELAEFLVQRSADVNAADQRGATPLDFALEERNDAVAEVLRQHGAKQRPSRPLRRVLTDWLLMWWSL
jgi:ankyrin repeat protein